MQEKTRQSLDLLSRNKSEVHPLLPADARTTRISSFSPDHQPSNLPKYHPKKKQHQNPNENLKKITEQVSKSAQAKSPNPPTSLQHPSSIPPTSLQPPGGDSGCGERGGGAHGPSPGSHRRDATTGGCWGHPGDATGDDATGGEGGPQVPEPRAATIFDENGPCKVPKKSWILMWKYHLNPFAPWEVPENGWIWMDEDGKNDGNWWQFSWYVMTMFLMWETVKKIWENDIFWMAMFMIFNDKNWWQQNVSAFFNLCFPLKWETKIEKCRYTSKPCFQSVQKTIHWKNCAGVTKGVIGYQNYPKFDIILD